MPIDLTWIAPEGCPGPSAIVAEAGAGPPIRARAVVTHEEKGTFRVVLETERAGVIGRRTLEAESCTAAAEATALILELSLHAEPASAPPPASAPAPTAPRTAPPQAERRFALRAGIASDTALLPSLSVAPALAIAWRPGAWGFEIGGSYALSQRAAAAGAGADFFVWSLGARVGYRFVTGVVSFGPIASADIARMAAHGFGGTTSFDQNAFFGLFGVGGAVAWSPLENLSLRLAIEGRAAAGAPTFVVTSPPAPAAIVHEPSEIGGRGEIGIEWSFL